MWHLKIMRELLRVLPETHKKRGEYFLKKLFLSVEEVEEGDKPEIDFFLGLIEKSFLKFENKKPGSVSLTEFSRHILGLTMLYLKSSDDFTIWNNDFIPTLGLIKKFLNVDNGKSMIKFLNQIELETFASLDHKVNINFDHLRSILNKSIALELKECGTSSIAQFFIDTYSTELDKDNCCEGFKLLIQDAKTLVEENLILSIFKSIPGGGDESTTNNEAMERVEGNLKFSFGKSHRLSIFQSITDDSDESARNYKKQRKIH